MNATSALAGMLSAGADANSRVASAQIAANAANANAAAALQGDVYRSNVQHAIAQRGLDADMSRTAGDFLLRRVLGGRQLDLEGSRLGLDRRRVDLADAEQRRRLDLLEKEATLNQSRFDFEKDWQLGGIGRGPYAPNLPAPAQSTPANLGGALADYLRSALFGGQSGGTTAGAPEPVEAFARRMLLANPGDPRIAGAYGPIIDQAGDRQLRRDEFEFKRSAANDVNQVFASILPGILSRNDIDIQDLPALRERFASAYAPTQPTGGAPQTPNLAQAAKTAGADNTQGFLAALKLDLNQSPGKIGEALGARIGSLTPSDLATLQNILVARRQLNPEMFSGFNPEHPGVALVLRLMQSPVNNLRPAELQTQYEQQRQSFFDKLNRESLESAFGGSMQFPY